MSKSLEKDLEQWYGGFSHNHNQERRDLMSSLPTMSRIRSSNITRFGTLPFILKSAAAVAAALVIAWTISIASSPNPQNVWAAAVEQAGYVHSMHLKATTSPSNAGAEIWWRRPGDFRMVWHNGNIQAGNAEANYNFHKNTNTLTINSSIPALGMAVLGPFKQIFAGDSLSQGWAKNSELINSSTIPSYKGMPDCQKLVFEQNDRRCEYVVDPQTRLIYEASMYSRTQPERLIYHMEVLDIDRKLPDSIFTIEPTAGVTVVDRRSGETP